MKKLTLRRFAAIVGVSVAAALVITVLSFTPFFLMIRSWLEQCGLEINWTLLSCLAVSTCAALFAVKTKNRKEDK